MMRLTWHAGGGRLNIPEASLLPRSKMPAPTFEAFYSMQDQRVARCVAAYGWRQSDVPEVGWFQRQAAREAFLLRHTQAPRQQVVRLPSQLTSVFDDEVDGDKSLRLVFATFSVLSAVSYPSLKSQCLRRTSVPSASRSGNIKGLGRGVLAAGTAECFRVSNRQWKIVGCFSTSERL